MKNQVNEILSLDQLKRIELNNLTYLARALYDNLMEIFYTKHILKLPAALLFKNPNTFDEMLLNIKNISDISAIIKEQYKKEIEISTSVLMSGKEEGECIVEGKEFDENYMAYNIILNKIISLFEYLRKTVDFLKVNLDKQEFSRIISKKNFNIDNLLNTIINNVAKFDVFNQGYGEKFGKINENFNVLDYPELSMQKSKTDSKIIEPTIESKSVVYKPELDLSEIERREIIDKANKLYDELVNDCIKDLNKQVSASSYDLYKDFVENRFANFVKQYSMPLKRDASTAEAKEVCRQINKLMDRITYISEQSYSINKFSE